MVSPIEIVFRVVDQGEQIHNTDTGSHSQKPENELSTAGSWGGGRTHQHKADACNSNAVHTLMN